MSGLMRRLYYIVTGKKDQRKIYVLKYQVSGTYTVCIRAESIEKAKEKAARRFEYKERFGDLESPEIISCLINEETTSDTAVET